MSQKRDRAIKFTDDIKRALTPSLPQVKRSDFAVKIEHYRAEFREQPESDYGNVAQRLRAYVVPLLKNVTEATADEVKASLHQLDLAVSGRRR